MTATATATTTTMATTTMISPPGARVSLQASAPQSPPRNHSHVIQIRVARAVGAAKLKRSLIMTHLQDGPTSAKWAGPLLSKIPENNTFTDTLALRTTTFNDEEVLYTMGLSPTVGTLRKDRTADPIEGGECPMTSRMNTPCLKPMRI